MIISKSKLRDYVAPKGVDFDKAWLMVKYHYCNPLSRRNRCPGNCASCTGTLAAIFDVGKADNVLAVLRWRMDSYMAGDLSIWANTTPKEKPGRLDDLGLPLEANPFDLLGQQLSRL